MSKLGQPLNYLFKDLFVDSLYNSLWDSRYILPWGSFSDSLCNSIWHSLKNSLWYSLKELSGEGGYDESR